MIPWEPDPSGEFTRKTPRCATAATGDGEVLEQSGFFDKVIYSATQGAMFGLRSNWIYKMDPDTGDVISKVRWTNRQLMSATPYMVEVGNFLYCSMQNISGLDNLRKEVWEQADRDIFQIDPSTMTLVGGLGLYTEMIASTVTRSWASFSHLMTDGTQIFGMNCIADLFRVTPSNPAGYIRTDAGFTWPTTNFNRGWPVNVEWEMDTDNGVIWAPEPVADTVYAYVKSFTDGGNAGEAHSTPFEPNGGGQPNYPNAPKPPMALCRVPGTNKLYVVSQTNQLQKCNGDAAVADMPAFLNNFTWSRINLADTGATPVRIRYNPDDGLIYIPTLASDNVIIFNPSGDTVVQTISGFTAPRDIVFTPNKIWAVQNAGAPLRAVE